MEIIALPHEVQRELRRGVAQGRKVFRKGRTEKIPFARNAAKNG